MFVEIRKLIRGTVDAALLGSGVTIEAAIRTAMSLPGLEFASARDELDAQIAAFRRKRLNLEFTGENIISQGLN